MFDAAEDAEAVVHGRILARPHVAASYGRTQLASVVQRWDDGDWAPVTAWMPRPREAHREVSG